MFVNWRKLIVTSLVALAMTAAQTGMAPSGGAAEQVKVRIGWQPSTQVLFYLAREDKLFEEAGFAPEYLRFNAGPPMFAALAAGDLDLGYMGAPPAVIAMAEGLPVKYIFTEDNVANGEALVVRADAGIQSLADLKGKTIGVWRGTSAEFALGRVLKTAGLASDDVKILDLDVTAIIPAFEKGEVDGVHVWDPWALRLEKLGGKQLATDASVGVQLPSGWLVRSAWVDENSAAAGRFVAVLEKARAIMLKDPDRAAAITAGILEMDKAEVTEMLARDLFPTASEQLEPNHPLSMDPATVAAGKGLAEHLLAIAQFFKANGRITAIPDTAKYVDVGPLKSAVGQ